MRSLVVYGAGGHAKVVAEIARLSQWEVVGFIDGVNLHRKSQSFYGSQILGGDEILEDLIPSGVKHAIVAFGNNRLRVATARKLVDRGFSLISVIHPSVVYSKDLKIGDGTVVAAGVVVGPSTKIGEHVIINTHATLDHECSVSDGAHIGPGAVVSGGVLVGECAWIGAGAVISDHKEIGVDSIVGAGAVVVKNVPDAVVAVGVPAKVIRKINL